MTKSTRVRITQQDIAKVAGVAQTVVSAVLRNDFSSVGVSENNKKRVLEIARALGYRLNTSAVSLRSGRFGNIGYLVASDGHVEYDFMSCRAGIYDAAEQHDFRVIHGRLRVDGPPLVEQADRLFQRAHLDAIIAHAPEVAYDRLAEALSSSRLPYVLLNYDVPYNAARHDDSLAMERLCAHVLERGYRNIKFVEYEARAHQGAAHPSTYIRENAYRRMMHEAGLVSGIWTITPQTTVTELQTWMQTDRPDCVMAGSDACALHFQRLCQHTGLLPGRDFGFTSINDEDLNQFLAVPTTTWRVPFYEIAENAVAMAIELAGLESGARIKSRTMQGTLKIRASTPGPAAHRK